MTLKLGSLFDGAGGFPFAAQQYGIEPIWASEIEPFPIAVTKKNFPNMKHLGDVSKINGAEVEPVEIVLRRLTPTECARLQGMPDWWCDDLAIAEPTEEDMAFWREVFETYRQAIDPSKKPKTDAQIKKWLADPVSDSAMYKMWGNGMALPCVMYVMEGISLELHRQALEGLFG